MLFLSQLDMWRENIMPQLFLCMPLKPSHLLKYYETKLRLAEWYAHERKFSFSTKKIWTSYATEKYAEDNK